jgi:hypothetical protein
MEERRGFVVWQSVVANPLTTNTSALANWNLARSIHGIASAISGWTFGQWSIYIERLMRKAAPSVADFARPTFMDKAVYVVTKRESKPLSEKDGPLLVVAPGHVCERQATVQFPLDQNQ